MMSLLLNDFRFGSCRGQCERLFVRPPTLKPAMNRMSADAKTFRPFREAHCLAVECQKATVLLLSRLFFQRRPDAITWTVSEVVVDAMQRKVSRWTRTHVIEKLLKLMPSLADLDASAAVVFPAFISAVLAALPHAQPRVMFRRIRLTVRLHLRSRVLALPTAATLCFQKVGASDKGFTSAATSATPHDGTSRALIGWFYSRQATGYETSQVFCCVIETYTLISHAVSLLIGDVVVRGCGSLATNRSLAWNYT